MKNCLNLAFASNFVNNKGTKPKTYNKTRPNKTFYM